MERSDDPNADTHWLSPTPTETETSRQRYTFWLQCHPCPDKKTNCPRCHISFVKAISLEAMNSYANAPRVGRQRRELADDTNEFDYGPSEPPSGYA